MEENIVQALLNLMKNHSYHKISVSMICQQVPVSRPTFYHYFHDKDDVLKWFVKDDFMKNCYPVYKYHMKEKGVQYFFKYIKDKEDIYYNIYLIDDGQFLYHALFEAYYTAIPLMDEYSNRVKKRDIIDTQVFYQFSSAGIANVIIFWIKDNMKKPIEVIAKELYYMMEKSMTEVRDYHLQNGQ